MFLQRVPFAESRFIFICPRSQRTEPGWQFAGDGFGCVCRGPYLFSLYGKVLRIEIGVRMRNIWKDTYPEQKKGGMTNMRIVTYSLRGS